MVSVLRRFIPAGGDAAEDNPLWLIVLCDLMTNLMLFFLVLYSFTLNTEEDKAQAMAQMQASVRGESVEGKKRAAAEIVQNIQEQEAAVAILREFEKAGLTDLTQVDVSESQVRIRMEAPALFPSAGAELSARAKKNLAPIGRMLRAIPNSVIVEGHTDDVPIASGRYRTNWELSTARAYAVIRFLARTCRMPEGRFVAAGYGEFRPIGSNKTREGRAKNRRIEIVIMRKASAAVAGKEGERQAPEGAGEFEKVLKR